MVKNKGEKKTESYDLGLLPTLKSFSLSQTEKLQWPLHFKITHSGKYGVNLKVYIWRDFCIGRRKTAGTAEIPGCQHPVHNVTSTLMLNATTKYIFLHNTALLSLNT